MAKQNQCQSIAYTYSEPTVFYEYMYDTSVLAKKNNIKNLFISAGFINPKPMKQLVKVLDAANIDIKAYDEEYYRNICFGALKPVLKTLEICAQENIILEITYLIVPTLNDNLKSIYNMCKWFVKNLGPQFPLHFSRFYPMYKLKNLPPTSSETLIKAKNTALDAGMHFVYVGNIYVKDGESTFCPSCHKILVERYGYAIIANKIVNNKCPYCGNKIYGLWS